MDELSLSEFDCTVIKSETVFAVTDAELTILKMGGAESAFLDFFATRLAVPGWGGEAGDTVKEVSLRFLLRLVWLRLCLLPEELYKGDPTSPSSN